MRFWSSLWNIYLYSSKHNGQPRGKAGRQVVNCFKMCIFAVASTIVREIWSHGIVLWIASKCVSLQWQAQSLCFARRMEVGCELLQNVYLCSGKHNIFPSNTSKRDVVNCFKMCIFAVASTIKHQAGQSQDGCELLQNVYLCSGKHNQSQKNLQMHMLWIASKCVSLQWQAQFTHGGKDITDSCELLQNVYLCSGKHNASPSTPRRPSVVNCFKMCIFAVASTIIAGGQFVTYGLWIASKCVSLQWQAQSLTSNDTLDISCELLQNVYLCSGKHNKDVGGKSLKFVVNCFKMCIFAVASTIRTKFYAFRDKLWIASKCVSLQWQAQCQHQKHLSWNCCELLQNVYLCSGKHNAEHRTSSHQSVVNCFKMCIFAVASTIIPRNFEPAAALWIASKCVSLQWQAQ